jgi:excisionase family DNA binding protein
MTMYKVAEVAARLKCSPSFVYEVIANGELQHYRLGKGQGGIRVSEAQLEQFLEGRERGTDPTLRPNKPAKRFRPRHLDV